MEKWNKFVEKMEKTEIAKKHKSLTEGMRIESKNESKVKFRKIKFDELPASISTAQVEVLFDFEMID